MQLDTTRFGTIEYEPDSVITFTQPIIGFQEHRRFILRPGPGDCLVWLQSCDAGDLAFILLDPRAVVSDYQVTLSKSDLAELAVTSVDELDFYTLVVVPQDQRQVRTNLKAPILVNPKQRLAKQTVMEGSEYPIQFFLAQRQPGHGQPQEVSNARSDA